jgi:putative oxidoreductase
VVKLSLGSAIVFDWAGLRLTWEPRMLSILRIMAGLTFFQTGTSKLFHFPPPPANIPRVYDLFTLNPGLQAPLELVGGLLILLGLFTRPVAFILAGDMAVAYFMAHLPRSFFPAVNGGTAAILYCFVFLYLFVAGGGAWSLDQVWKGGSAEARG